MAEPKGNLHLYEESMKDNHKEGSCRRRLMGRGRQQGVRLHPQQAPPPGGGALRKGGSWRRSPGTRRGHIRREDTRLRLGVPEYL